MKNRYSLALIALLLFAFSLPSFVFSQQRRDQANSSAGVTPTGKNGPATGVPSRRPRVRGSANPTEAVKQDFSEALEVIQQHYIDGNKLDYNNVYKSSIIGMLRTLDPHSKFFTPKEFTALREDQRPIHPGPGNCGHSCMTYDCNRRCAEPASPLSVPRTSKSSA